MDPILSLPSVVPLLLTLFYTTRFTLSSVEHSAPFTLLLVWIALRHKPFGGATHVTLQMLTTRVTHVTRMDEYLHPSRLVFFFGQKRSALFPLPFFSSRREERHSHLTWEWSTSKVGWCVSYVRRSTTNIKRSPSNVRDLHSSRVYLYPVGCLSSLHGVILGHTRCDEWMIHIGRGTVTWVTPVALRRTSCGAERSTCTVGAIHM